MINYYDEMINNQMQQNQEREYKKLSENCSKIQTGDIVMCGGNDLVSRAIMFVTKSDVAHAGVVVRSSDIKREEHIPIAEARPLGVVMRYYSYYFINSSCWIGRVYDTLTIDERILLRSEILKMINKGYDYKAIFEIAKYLIFKGRGVPQNDLLSDEARVMCIEMVCRAYWNAFEKKLVNKRMQLTTAEDLKHSKHIVWYKDYNGWHWDKLGL